MSLPQMVGSVPGIVFLFTLSNLQSIIIRFSSWQKKKGKILDSWRQTHTSSCSLWRQAITTWLMGKQSCVWLICCRCILRREATLTYIHVPTALGVGRVACVPLIQPKWWKAQIPSLTVSASTLWLASGGILKPFLLSLSPFPSHAGWKMCHLILRGFFFSSETKRNHWISLLF